MTSTFLRYRRVPGRVWHIIITNIVIILIHFILLIIPFCCSYYDYYYLLASVSSTEQTVPKLTLVKSFNLSTSSRNGQEDCSHLGSGTIVIPQTEGVVLAWIRWKFLVIN